MLIETIRKRLDDYNKIKEYYKENKNTCNIEMDVAVRTAVPVAVPSEKTTVGTAVYPVPLGDTVILAIVVGASTDEAVAPVPPPPVNTTVGALV